MASIGPPREHRVQEAADPLQLCSWTVKPDPLLTVDSRMNVHPLRLWTLE